VNFRTGRGLNKYIKDRGRVPVLSLRRDPNVLESFGLSHAAPTHMRHPLTLSRQDRCHPIVFSRPLSADVGCSQWNDPSCPALATQVILVAPLRFPESPYHAASGTSVSKFSHPILFVAAIHKCRASQSTSLITSTRSRTVSLSEGRNTAKYAITSPARVFRSVQFASGS